MITYHATDFNLTDMTTDTLTLGNSISSLNSITMNTTSNSLDVKGRSFFKDDLTIEGDADIVLKGKKLSSLLDKISERLVICHLNPALEERWEQLKALGDEYRKLEKELIEAEKTFEIMKT